jgi:hypothetical protein
VDTFKDDMIFNASTYMGVGSGSTLALEFYLDSGALFRNSSAKNSFRIGLGSQQDIFDIRAVANLAKPGFKMILEVNPIEVVATMKLRNVPMAIRECRFEDEYQDIMEIFNVYSQSACR